MTTLYTFGDSVLCCGMNNEHGATPGASLARNDHRLFPGSPDVISRPGGALPCRS